MLKAQAWCFLWTILFPVRIRLPPKMYEGMQPFLSWSGSNGSSVLIFATLLFNANWTAAGTLRRGSCASLNWRCKLKRACYYLTLPPAEPWNPDACIDRESPHPRSFTDNLVVTIHQVCCIRRIVSDTCTQNDDQWKLETSCGNC